MTILPTVLSTICPCSCGLICGSFYQIKIKSHQCRNLILCTSLFGVSLCDAYRAVYTQSNLTTLDPMGNNNSMLYDPYKWDSSRENERQGSEQRGQCPRVQVYRVSWYHVLGFSDR